MVLLHACVPVPGVRAFLTLRAVLSGVITRWDLGLKEFFHVVFHAVSFGHYDSKSLSKC